MSNRGHGRVQQKILRLMADGKARTSREIATELGANTSVISGKVQFLYLWGANPENSLLTHNGEFGKLNARKWVITDAGRSKIK